MAIDLEVAGIPILKVAVAALATLFCEFAFRLYTRRSFFRGLPGPPHSFIWGHLKVMGEVAKTMPPNMHPQAYLTAIAQKYQLKGIFYMDLWPIAESQVVLLDPELMNYINITKPLAQHSMANDFLAPVLGRNVISVANGPVWKTLHNAMAPAFSPGHVRNLVPVFVDEVSLFRDTLDKFAQSKEVFSMEDTAAKLIFDVIARVVFNVPLHAQTKGSQYLDDLREMVQLAEKGLSWNPLVKTSSFFKRWSLNRRLNPAIKKQIQERFELLKRDNVVPSRKDPFSVLDLMLRELLQEVAEDTSAESLKDMDPAFMKLLITNMKGLLLGGHGTTIDTLCYIYMLLSKNPHVVEKLREEHTHVFKKGVAGTLDVLQKTPEKLSELEYTAAVIKEALRLFPVGFGVRVAEQRATIPYNGKDYPIGSNLAVIALAHHLHYNSDKYPDSDKFDPTRFTDPENTISRANFRTFGRGARACLGQNLAQEELKVILLMTVRDYDFECADLLPNKSPRTTFTSMDTIYGDIIFQELGIEAKPRGGMMMRVKKRS